LPDRYDDSVVAAKWALSERAEVAFYADLRKSAGHGRPEGLYESSRALCRSFDSGRGPQTSVGSERVIKDVMRLTGANLEASRSHFLELLWEVAWLVEQRQAVDAIAVTEMRAHTSERILRTRTVRELCLAFSESIASFARLLEPPRGVTLRVRLERARRFIVENGYRRRLDFSALAKRVGLSRPYLSRSFKAAYGVGVAEFVLRVRLEQSKKLLRESSASITAVSNATGFSSPSYFHQAFRRAERLTPRAYREAGNP
jgi:AraC-like DNA-binding protein